jgi:hypothetical protein
MSSEQKPKQGRRRTTEDESVQSGDESENDTQRARTKQNIYFMRRACPSLSRKDLADLIKLLKLTFERFFVITQLFGRLCLVLELHLIVCVT